MRALVWCGYAHSRKYSSSHVAVHVFHSTLMYWILTHHCEALCFWNMVGSILSMHSAGCVPNQLCEHPDLPKHDLMAPGSGSRFTNFFNWRENNEFVRGYCSGNLEVMEPPQMCVFMLFYHMWWYDTICEHTTFLVIMFFVLKKVKSDKCRSWPNQQLHQDETLCPWGTSQLCWICVYTLALIKLKLFIFTSFIRFFFFSKSLVIQTQRKTYKKL